MSTSKPWFQDFFKEFRPFFGLVPAKTTNRQVSYLIRKLNLKRGMSFLDCPCGIGRLAIPLARQGVKVVGVDLCKEYLDELDRIVKRTTLKIETVHSDMRKINFKNRFDAAGNLWTSFGYFDSERDSLLVLKKMYQALKPGGKFCLFVINRDWILHSYTETDWGEIDGMLYLEKRKFEYETSINRGTWTFIKDGRSKKFKGDIRMYCYHELLAMLRRVGFVNIEGFGNEKDGPITRDSMMMWIFGVKPK